MMIFMQHKDQVRYHHLVQELQVLLQQNESFEAQDYFAIEKALMEKWQIDAETLHRQGLRRAYRQVVEGI